MILPTALNNASQSSTIEVTIGGENELDLSEEEIEMNLEEEELEMEFCENE